MLASEREIKITDPLNLTFSDLQVIISKYFFLVSELMSSFENNLSYDELLCKFALLTNKYNASIKRNELLEELDDNSIMTLEIPKTLLPSGESIYSTHGSRTQILPPFSM